MIDTIEALNLCDSRIVFSPDFQSGVTFYSLPDLNLDAAVLLT
jgi:hypothetical protein